MKKLMYAVLVYLALVVFYPNFTWAAVMIDASESENINGGCAIIGHCYVGLACGDSASCGTECPNGVSECNAEGKFTGAADECLNTEGSAGPLECDLFASKITKCNGDPPAYVYKCICVGTGSDAVCHMDAQHYTDQTVREYVPCHIALLAHSQNWSLYSGVF